VNATGAGYLVLADALGDLCEGQALELRDAFDPDRSIDDHIASIRGKTAALFACAFRLGAHCGGVSPRNAWPMRAEERWGYYRTNDVVHATYWIAEWPRIDVGPDFLAPLLVQTRSQRTVAVTMEPVPPLKAMRAVGFAKTADVADEELRQKLGFLGTAKRRNQADAVARREQELADGHADVRFSGYITVTADNPEALAEACGEVEHAAGQSRLELQRCDGEQEIAFSYTLPLGRGLK
jgi:hypothetical protein